MQNFCCTCIFEIYFKDWYKIYSEKRWIYQTELNFLTFLNFKFTHF